MQPAQFLRYDCRYGEPREGKSERGGVSARCRVDQSTTSPEFEPPTYGLECLEPYPIDQPSYLQHM